MASASAMDKDKPEGETPRGKSAEKGLTEASLNMSELRELADLVDEHGFTDFEFENEKIRVRLSKTVPAPIMAQPAHYAPPPVQTTATSAVGDTGEAPAVDPADDLYQITSPIVGTFYRAPGPDKEPYVKEGSSVSPDTVVCIVEAMKLMNEIQAETSGEIVKVYVENGQPVEYGQPLFGIKK
jgi:acetyl-CoA carboxylase biotin carboxyl carrier protein